MRLAMDTMQKYWESVWQGVLANISGQISRGQHIIVAALAAIVCGWDCRDATCCS